LLALQLGAVERATAIERIGRGTVHAAGVVPHQRITYRPFVAAAEAFLRRRVAQIDQQLDPVQRVHAEDVDGAVVDVGGVIQLCGRQRSAPRAGLTSRSAFSLEISMACRLTALGTRFGDGSIFAADSAETLDASGRVKHDLGGFGRDEKDRGRELLTLFAGNPQEAVDQLRKRRASRFLIPL